MYAWWPVYVQCLWIGMASLAEKIHTQKTQQNPLEKSRLWCWIVNAKHSRGKSIYVALRCTINPCFKTFSVADFILRTHMLLSSRDHYTWDQVLKHSWADLLWTYLSDASSLCISPGWRLKVRGRGLRRLVNDIGRVSWNHLWEFVLSSDITVSIVIFLLTYLFLIIWWLLASSSSGDSQVSFLLHGNGRMDLFVFKSSRWSCCRWWHEL